MKGRLKIASLEYYTTVQPIGQPLQDGTSNRIAVVDLPKARRCPAVASLVVVMKRPDAVLCDVEDRAARDTESKLNKKVEF